MLRQNRYITFVFSTKKADRHFITTYSPPVGPSLPFTRQHIYHSLSSYVSCANKHISPYANPSTYIYIYVNGTPDYRFRQVAGLSRLTQYHVNHPPY